MNLETFVNTIIIKSEANRNNVRPAFFTQSNPAYLRFFYYRFNNLPVVYFFIASYHFNEI